MPSCLGLYIEDNLIKYAKVSKDNGITKIESYGIKFFEKMDEAIKQIIAETFSYKIPISMNSTNEIYEYFSFINLLNKKDLNKVIQTEFEGRCEEKGQNSTAFETRYALINDLENREKIRVLHLAANKAEITRKKTMLENNKLTCIAPLPMAIANLLNDSDKENVMIINIEEKTTITTILNQTIYEIQTLEAGTKQILDKIQEKENSYAKAYEICKNTTIYTSDAQDLQVEENPYLVDIMPTLYSIVEQITNIINNTLQKIDKVYITGTATVINNIDIYFEQYLPVQCEILKPPFAKESIGGINIKDYIEVNSAVALALQGLGEGIKTMNFIKPSLTDRLPDWMKIELGSKSDKKEGKHKDTEKKKKIINNDFKSPITKVEKNLLRSFGGTFGLFIIYVLFSIVISSQMNKKSEEISIAETNMEQKISSINSDISKVSKKTSDYTTAIENIQKLNEERAENLRIKNAIPTLLTQIMNVVPIKAQITSIQNTETKHIVINAQSENYEQLGYFIAKIKADTILTNVVSSSGQKQDGIVKVTIEGDLP